MAPHFRAGTPENPLPAPIPTPPDPTLDPSPPPEEIDWYETYIKEGASIPEDVLGSYLTSAPVIEGGMGHTSPVYIDPDYAIGYGYTTSGTNRFRTFEIPAPLPLGDDLFEIHHLGESYPLTAGVPFDFTTLDPTGVESFVLLGIDEAETLNADTPDPFVYGVSFMTPGTVDITSFALVSVPEPSADFNGDGFVDFTDFVDFSNVFGQKVPPADAKFDLSGNGEIDFADFVQFSNAFGTGVAAVPEPANLTLLLGGGTLVLVLRRRHAF